MNEEFDNQERIEELREINRIARENLEASLEAARSREEEISTPILKNPFVRNK